MKTSGQLTKGHPVGGTDPTNIHHRVDKNTKLWKYIHIYIYIHVLEDSKKTEKIVNNFFSEFFCLRVLKLMEKIIHKNRNINIYMLQIC